MQCEVKKQTGATPCAQQRKTKLVAGGPGGGAASLEGPVLGHLLSTLVSDGVGRSSQRRRDKFRIQASPTDVGYDLVESILVQQHTGSRVAPHVKLAPMGAPWPSAERQEHLDAVIACAGAGQWRRIFRVLDVLTVKRSTGDLPDCRFFLTRN